jgi:long-chain acyl-CoA synthetase
VLVSGAEGAVGAEGVAALARRPEVERIGVGRAPPAGGGEAGAARRRGVERLAGWAAGQGTGEGAGDGSAAALGERLEPIAGDPAAHRFGLDPGGWEALAAGGGEVGVHLGEAAGLGGGLAAARRAHLDPVDGWIALVDRAPGLRLVELSSCLVGGRRRGLLTEFDLDGGAGFRNAWEQSRSEAEHRLADSPVRGRVTVVRPSHPVGRAADGAVWAPPAIYPLLAALAGGGWLPGDPEARLDLVPVDWVARALVALAAEPAAAGGTFHLVAGWGRSITAAELARRVAEAAGRARPARLAPLPAAALLGAVAFAGGARSDGRKAARDYLRQGPVFDDFMAARALAGLGVAPPPAAAETVAAAIC